MERFVGFERGMGIGGWLTNYKRFNVLPIDRRLDITVGDMEHFRTYITKDDVAYIASLGMDHVRLGFDQIVVESKPGVYREEIFQIMQRFVDWCREYKLNVVLNLHKAIGNYCDIPEKVQLLDDKDLQENFIRLWSEFEHRFSGYPEVAFELLNELRDVDPEKWNVLAEKALGALRALNPNRVIIIGSTHWNNVHTLKDLKIFDDENVVYTFHAYYPLEFTHQQGVLRPEELYYNRKLTYPGDIEKYRDYQKVVYHNEDAYPGLDVMDEKYMNAELAPAAEFKKANPGKIVWCGEFGTIRHADIKSRENYMRDIIRFCKRNDIPYCVWNYLSTPNDGNRFSLVDDDNRRILSEEMGRIIRGEV